jgi:peptide/nickel transport system ATP-binding protein
VTLLSKIDALSVTYSRSGHAVEALKGINLALGESERIAIIGESGSGKSTLALALAGLLPATAEVRGSITWPGLGHAPRSGADIGFVFQDPGASLDPVVRVGAQVAEVAAVHLGPDRPAARSAAGELFARVGLPASTLDAYPHQLSGGQKQRVAIAAAIAGRPALLIADEPTSALDTIVQAEIMRLIRDLAAGDGMALLLISHDIALAAGIAERIAVLRHGEIIEIGATADIVHRPTENYTRALLAASAGLEMAGPE